MSKALQSGDQEPLPIYAHQHELLEAVAQSPVVICQGAAGCGKTTQIPRILYHAGLIKRCMAITQPRRIAAVSVAWRIAQEEQVPIGELVGYGIRFDDCTSNQTRIKIMTDGLLLQEARRDRLLQQYDIIMVDEVHERSLNIDLVLGLLRDIVDRRPDIKLLISSATLHQEALEQFFYQATGQKPPIITVSSRTFPLDITYAPASSSGEVSFLTAVEQHILAHVQRDGSGHILAFLPGESTITKLQQQLILHPLIQQRGKVLPLFGRLTRVEQEAVFAIPPPSVRKIILATNIAETSITVDGVDLVIDTGLAKFPWYRADQGLTALREQPISQASAIQRAGRAGRTGPGRVVRLYSEASFAERLFHTPEEIVRIDLAEALLRMIDLGIDQIETFPLLTPPPIGKIKAGLRQLQALGAIDGRRRLTAVGKQMVPYPLTPPLARMIVESANRFPQSLYDVLAIGAYVSVRSPFQYPPGLEEAAKVAQRPLHHPMGDLLTGLKTLRLYQQAEQPEQFCQRHYLDRDTMAFIHQAHSQLCAIAVEHELPVQHHPIRPADIIRCVAAGFADKLLKRQGWGYLTPYGLRVSLHPGSTLSHNKPAFAVATELFQAGRTMAVNVSPMEKSWYVDHLPHIPEHHRPQQERSVPKRPQSKRRTQGQEQRPSQSQPERKRRRKRKPSKGH